MADNDDAQKKELKSTFRPIWISVRLVAFQFMRLQAEMPLEFALI